MSSYSSGWGSSWDSLRQDQERWTRAAAEEENRKRKQKARARASVEQEALVVEKQRAILVMFSLLNAWGTRRVVNLLVLGQVGRIQGDPFVGIRAGNGASRAIATVLCRLRENGCIGIGGFSGADPRRLERFIQQSYRLDVHIFPSIEQFVDKHLATA